MVVTNKSEGEPTIWNFMAGRGGHEKTLSELKQHLAFGSVVTDDWDANSAWQLLSALTHNLVRHFQLEAGLAPKRGNSRPKRTAHLRGAGITRPHRPRPPRPRRLTRAPPAAQPQDLRRIGASPSKLAPVRVGGWVFLRPLPLQRSMCAAP
jgi:hypothetical protein